MSSKAVILTGGPSKGTRMRPLSLDIPKPLFPIAGRPMIWHHIQALSKVEGMHEVLLVGFYEDSVMASFVREASKDFPNLSIRYLREYTSLGTAGGLYHFRDAILKGNPSQIFVIHADICFSYPLSEMIAFHENHRGVGTIMGVKVPRKSATKYGCIVTNPQTMQALHYVEKPESFISDTINGGVYLFDKSIFDEIKVAMDDKVRRQQEDPLANGGLEGEEQDDELLRLEQDVLAPLASNKKLYVYMTPGYWRQIKSAGSAVPANGLMLGSYKTTNPMLLRQRSPTISAKSRSDRQRSGPTIVEPCFIDETAEVDANAKIGPNVSIGAGAKIGYGCRVKEALILDGAVLEKNSCALYAIISEGCKLGQWARVEGTSESTDDKLSIAILAKDVTVKPEVSVRSCIVLPHKTLTKSCANEVLL